MGYMMTEQPGPAPYKNVFSAEYFCRECRKMHRDLHDFAGNFPLFDREYSGLMEILPQTIEHECGGIADLLCLTWGDVEYVPETGRDLTYLHDVVKRDWRDKWLVPPLKIINRALLWLNTRLAEYNDRKD